VQFPRDLEADKYTDETMLGDELLLAAGQNVYLPQGIWTNLKSNAISRGRQVIRINDPPAVFARNGSIVPMTAADTLELHYFPKLGAEFFLYEEDVSDYSQVHAAPAADIIRLEIESKMARDYTWIIHHIQRATSVGFGATAFSEVKTLQELRDRTWYYDPDAQNLYARDRVRAGQDHIVNLTF
jgi:alpha-glucosidase (family GH31 glycosyl hydrolase)